MSAEAVAGLAGIVLAGGRSSRMGSDKACLMLDGVSFLDRARRLLTAAGASPVWVAGRPGEPDGVADPDPHAGPARALLSVLSRLPHGVSRLAVIPVDMPLLTVADIAPLVACDRSAAWAGHPFPLVLRIADLAGCEPVVSMRALLDAAGARRLRPAAGRERRLFNVNTLQDLEDVRTFPSSSHGPA